MRLIATLALILVSSLAWAAPIQLTLDDGRTVTGDLVRETDTQFIVDLPDGSTVVINKTDVKQVAIPEDEPLAIPTDTPAQPPPKAPPPRVRYRSPAYGFGVNVAMGVRGSPFSGNPWSPIGWEEYALAKLPSVIAMDALTVELRIFSPLPGSTHDIFFDLHDALFLPIVTGPGRNRAYAISGGWIRHRTFHPGKVASFGYGSGTQLRIEGVAGQAFWLSLISVNRVGLDIRTKDQLIDIGVYARLEAGVTFGSTIETVFGALPEVVVRINKMRK